MHMTVTTVVGLVFANVVAVVTGVFGSGSERVVRLYPIAIYANG